MVVVLPPLLPRLLLLLLLLLAAEALCRRGCWSDRNGSKATATRAQKKEGKKDCRQRRCRRSFECFVRSSVDGMYVADNLCIVSSERRFPSL
ncbi:hypothetical protein LX36DRAFT_659901 [Colletotrichum falcatum]|nr:hypothetical protein LX36DRAFT_659901 [Colletotrichum falcatum]